MRNVFWDGEMMNASSNDGFNEVLWWLDTDPQ